MDIIEHNSSDDDVNLFHYWKIIAKRKWLLFGMFLIIMLITAIVNFSLPKIYRADVVLKMKTIEFTELLRKFNINESKSLANVCPNTYKSIEEIRATADTSNQRLKISFDIKDTSTVSLIISEIIEYVDNFPIYKKSVEQLRELQLNEMIEIKKIVVYLEEVMQKNNQQLNWIDRIIELKSRNEILNQSLKSNFKTEVTYQYIFEEPVKPLVKRNFVLMGIVGFLVAIFLIVIGESISRFNNPQTN